jgi:predicted phage baseplate assembly protein
VGDVLTFYQERIANEGFLRTSVERRSLLQLAKSMGYELKPGVAANACLVFTMEAAPGIPQVIELPTGTRVQSIPPPGKLTQIFETVETISARQEWNALRPKQDREQKIGKGLIQIFIRGVNASVAPGDIIVIIGAERESNPMSKEWEMRILSAVDADPSSNKIRLTWDAPLEKTINCARVFAFRQCAFLFGSNVPDWRSLPDELKKDHKLDYDPDNPSTMGNDWPGLEIRMEEWRWAIDLESIYFRVLKGSWILLIDQSKDLAGLYRVEGVSTRFRSDFALKSKVTRIQPDAGEGLSQFSIRDTLAYIQSEPLFLSQVPMEEPVQGSKVELEAKDVDLPADHLLVFSGNAQDGEDTFGEAAVVSSCDGASLVLREPLRNSYDRRSLIIYANVARATHGEIFEEVLGSGDGSRVNQTFTLKKPPLTYISSSDSGGSRNTLKIRVNGVLWKEAPSLLDQNEQSQVYVVRINDDGSVIITFGDGRRGSRLPSGEDNITAAYRSGIGPDGEVEAGTLRLLQSQPLGIRYVNNPLAASGAAPSESLADARKNVPKAISSLGRIVSFRDFESFALSFPGVGKAASEVILMDQGQIVHITVAGSRGLGGEDVLGLAGTLRHAIKVSSDLSCNVIVAGYRLKTFRISGGLWVDSRYPADSVKNEVEWVLRNTFSFENRDFGQPVSVTEVLTCMQTVDGVIAVRLDALQEDLEYVGDLQMALSHTSQSFRSNKKFKLKSGDGKAAHGIELAGKGSFGLSRSVREKPILQARGAFFDPSAGRTEPAELILISADADAIILKVLNQ